MRSSTTPHPILRLDASSCRIFIANMPQNLVRYGALVCIPTSHRETLGSQQRNENFLLGCPLGVHIDGSGDQSAVGSTLGVLAVPNSEQLSVPKTRISRARLVLSSCFRIWNSVQCEGVEPGGSRNYCRIVYARFIATRTPTMNPSTRS